MVASRTDLFKKTGASTVTTLAAPGKALAASSITVGSTTNYPADTGITIAIRVVDTDGELIAGTYTEWRATVTSGTTLSIDTAPVYGSDQVYAAGSTTQVFLPVSSSAHNELVSGLLTSIDQDGTLKAGAVDNAAVLASNVVTTAKILDANVTTAKIADANVTTGKIADDAITAAKMQYGLLRNRQGGTTGAGSYQTVGTSNTDTSATAVFFQSGSVVTSAGAVTVTFPTAFTQVPLIFATVNSASAANCFARITAQTVSTCIITAITDGGALAGAENINWFAIGQ